MKVLFRHNELEYIFNANPFDEDYYSLVDVESYLSKNFVPGIFGRIRGSIHYESDIQLKIVPIFLKDDRTASDLSINPFETLYEVKYSQVLELLLNSGLKPKSEDIKKALHFYHSHTCVSFVSEKNKIEYRKMIDILENYEFNVFKVRPEVHDSLEFLPEDMQRMCCEFVVAV